jgi:hypothetical protein
MMGQGYFYGGYYMNQTHFDPTHDNYFKHNLRCGGPLYPDSGFQEVFRTIFQRNLIDTPLHPEGKDSDSKPETPVDEDIKEEKEEFKEVEEYKRHPLHKILQEYTNNLTEAMKEKDDGQSKKNGQTLG